MGLSAASIVVLCSFAIQVSFFGTDFFLYHLERFLHITRVCFALSHGMALLLYPLLGWLSDVHFARYKVIRLAFIIMTIVGIAGIILGLAVVLDINLLHDSVARILLSMLTIPVILSVLLSLGLFKANAIQFGMDQLLESSSDQLSYFIHWYYWSSYVGHFILYIMLAGMVVINSNYTGVKMNKHPWPMSDYALIRLVFSLTLLQLILAVVGLFVLIRYKKIFAIEKPGHNPFLQIYKVLKYAWKHKFPENRSAFTYWENDIPPRIDLGKNKYGGPFTTEEVEDTKSFFTYSFFSSLYWDSTYQDTATQLYNS